MKHTADRTLRAAPATATSPGELPIADLLLSFR
jgi:hypothetical protein